MSAMKKFTNLVGGMMLIGITVFFQSCEPETMSLNEEPITTVDATIERSSLVGRWELESMDSDVAVNLNFDESSSTDILSETRCFDNMFYTFQANGDVTTGQAKLDFGPEDDEFKCNYGEYSASYDVNDQNELEVTFEYNGSTLTETKSISLYEEGTEEFMKVTLSEMEASAYVDDPGTTVASEIEEIIMVYKKVTIQ